MCGFVGVASQTHINQKDWLHRGVKALKHRGPDDSGMLWIDNNQVGLGHTRLSILDLTTAGRQPMQCSSKRLTIVFNGEIYNHLSLRKELQNLGYIFKSTTDTEVILAAYSYWGNNCLNKLEGMFAFALFDRLSRTLLIARDRAGEKPIYYSFLGNEIRFASELKALLADTNFPRKINRESLDCYLTMGYVPGPLCILQGTNKLSPGHALKYDLSSGKSELWQYWNVPQLSKRIKNTTESEIMDGIEIRLRNAVKSQMRSDVEIGCLLSGGIDSSLVVAFASEYLPKVNTYTVTFKKYGERFDESFDAKKVSNYFGTNHTEIEADDIDVSILQDLALHVDEPIADMSLIPTTMLAKGVSKKCKVALGGDGGDELFGGYHSYSRIAQLQILNNYKKFLPVKFISDLVSRLPIGSKGREGAQMLGVDLDSDLPLFSPRFDLYARKRLLANQANWKFCAETIRKARMPKSSNDSVTRLSLFDFSNYLAEDILVKVDRASMLNSLEVRSPFLDKSLIEYCYSEVPAHLKANFKSKKIILKKIAKKILPPSFDSKRKQGFGVPLGSWLRSGGPWRVLFEKILFDNNSMFCKSYISDLFHGIDNGRDLEQRLFGLVIFEIWRKEYKISL